MKKAHKIKILLYMLQARKSLKRKIENLQTEQQSEIDPTLWDSVIEGIVRPPRSRYHEEQLGQKMLRYKDKFYLRYDYNVPHQGKNIQLSLFATGNYGYHVILYLHGNASSRLQGTSLIKQIPNNVSLACFDFMGCGKNQQMETISLGYRESLQVKSVVNYLNQLGYKVIIWGRSMGAATALLYGKAQIIVADSTFRCFRSLCKQVAKKYTPKIVPGCMVSCVFPCVFQKLKKDVHKRAEYNVDELDIRKAVKKLNPKSLVIFMSGQKDELIHHRNSAKLFSDCPCEQKYLKLFEGSHNSTRPVKIMKEVMEIIQKRINNEKSEWQE